MNFSKEQLKLSKEKLTVHGHWCFCDPKDRLAALSDAGNLLDVATPSRNVISTFDAVEEAGAGAGAGAGVGASAGAAAAGATFAPQRAVGGAAAASAGNGTTAKARVRVRTTSVLSSMRACAQRQRTRNSRPSPQQERLSMRRSTTACATSTWNRRSVRIRSCRTECSCAGKPSPLGWTHAPRATRR
jgi:hypothetical protein